MRSLILLSAVLAAAPAVFADDHGLFARQGATSTQADRKKVDPSIVQILSGPEQNQRLASGTSKLSGDGAGSFCQTTSGLSGICMASKRCVRSGGKPEAGAVMGDPAAGAPTYCEGQTVIPSPSKSLVRSLYPFSLTGYRIVLSIRRSQLPQRVRKMHAYLKMRKGRPHQVSESETLSRHHSFCIY